MPRKSKINKTFKDYFIPVSWVALILILIASIFNSSSETIDNKNDLVLENDKAFIAMDLWSESSEAYIEYLWWKRKKIDSENSKLYKSEKVIVRDWNLILNLDWASSLRLAKLWELSYNDNWDFSLFSSSLWIDSRESLKLKMQFVNISIEAWSVVSVYQNEVENGIYVLKWIVNLSTLAWKKIILWANSYVSIRNTEASLKDLDLLSKKELIPDSFKRDEWFILNSWDSYLNNPSSIEKSSTWSKVSSSISSWNIKFNILDEAELSSDSIVLSWTYMWSDISSIKINWSNVIINADNSSFSSENISLKSRENDIVYKAYDIDSNLIEKWILTIYNTTWLVSTWNNTISVENFPLNSPEFKFISPKENPYTTTKDIVMIEWRVPVRTVDRIEVNWYKLKQFPSNGTYWKYFANKEYGNLKEGLNLYKVQYYDKDSKLIFENAFTIIKKEVKKETSWSVNNWTYSSEANL